MLRDIAELLALATATAGGFMLFGPVALIVAGGVTLLALEVTDRGPSQVDRVRGVRQNGEGRGHRSGPKVLR